MGEVRTKPESAPDAFGLVIKIDDKLVYIAGDTCLRLVKLEEIRCGRKFDIMIYPINGTFGNMSETYASEVSRVI